MFLTCLIQGVFHGLAVAMRSEIQFKLISKLGCNLPISCRLFDSCAMKVITLWMFWACLIHGVFHGLAVAMRSEIQFKLISKLGCNLPISCRLFDSCAMKVITLWMFWACLIHGVFHGLAVAMRSEIQCKLISKLGCNLRMSCRLLNSCAMKVNVFGLSRSCVLSWSGCCSETWNPV